MDPLILRENDIRGRPDVDITLPEVGMLGRAAGTYFRRHGILSVVVGRDTRATSSAWFREISKGVRAAGCDTVDIGVCTTPRLCFAVDYLRAGAGIMVTASHNTAEFNGLKLTIGRRPLAGYELREIYEIAQAGEFTRGDGRDRAAETEEAYLSALSSGLRLRRPLRVGLDAGSSPAGEVALRLLQVLGVEVVQVRDAGEAGTPYRLVDPAKDDHLAPLSRLVPAHGLDLGVAYDGDGDRLGVIGPGGEILRADDLLILFARNVLRNNPGATVVAEVLCSQRLFDEVRRLGGRAVMCRTGHSLVQTRMASEGALLAGELSGHFFFADRYVGISDAVYATGRLLETVAAGPRTIEELLADVTTVVSGPRVTIPCPEAIKSPVAAAVTRVLRDHAQRSGGEVIEIDGIRVTWPIGWMIVRPSNTEPAMVIRVEAVDDQHYEDILSLAIAVVKAELRTYSHDKTGRRPGSVLTPTQQAG